MKIGDEVRVLMLLGGKGEGGREDGRKKRRW